MSVCKPFAGYHDKATCVYFKHVCERCEKPIRAAFGQAGDALHPGVEHIHNGSYYCDDGTHMRSMT